MQSKDVEALPVPATVNLTQARLELAKDSEEQSTSEHNSVEGADSSSLRLSLSLIASQQAPEFHSEPQESQHQADLEQQQQSPALPTASPASTPSSSIASSPATIPPQRSMPPAESSNTPARSPCLVQHHNPLFDEEPPTKPSLIQKMEASHQHMLRQQLEHFRRELTAAEASLAARQQEALQMAQRQHAAQLTAMEAAYQQQVGELQAKLRAVGGELQRQRQRQQQRQLGGYSQPEVIPARRQRQGGYAEVPAREDSPPAVLLRRDSLPASMVGRQQTSCPESQEQQLRQAVPPGMLARKQDLQADAITAKRLPGAALGAPGGQARQLVAKQHERQLPLGAPVGVPRQRENRAAELQSKLWAVASQLSRQGGDGQEGPRGAAGRLRVEVGEVQAKLQAVEKELEEQEQRAPVGRLPAGRHLENRAAELSIKLRSALWQSERAAVWQQHRAQAHGPPSLAELPRPSRQSSLRLSQGGSSIGRVGGESGQEPRLPLQMQGNRPARAVLAQR